MNFMMLHETLNTISSKFFINLDLIVFGLFVTFAVYVLCQYIYYQIQRLNTHYYLLHLNSVVGNTIYNKERCPICLNEFKAPARASCGHAFCMQCLLISFQYNDYGWKCICPLCRKWIQDFDCLYKFDFSRKEKAQIKTLEKQLRDLISNQNSQIRLVQHFVWMRANKWKAGVITAIFTFLIGTFIYQFI